MTHTGIFRIYFNRHQAAPLVWCVAAMSGNAMCWEIAVEHVVLRAPARTAFVPKLEKDEDDGKPSAYLETYGELVITGGIATVYEADEVAAS